MPRRSWLLGVLVVAASPAAVSGAASDLVHACARNEGGLTRIVRSGESCRHSEHLVVWNAEGPQGPAGPAVPLGVAGPQGPAGPPGSGGGGGARKAVFEPFAVLKPIDALSPKLMLATATGRHFAKATIEIFGEGGSAAPPVLTWELTEVLVSAFGFSTKRDQPSDEVSLSFGKVCSIFEGVDDQGKPTGKVEECFDLKTGKP